MKNKMSEAWREWWSIVHGKNTPAGSYNPLEAHMYEAWVAAWDSANEHAQFEITHLKEQLLRVGNQQEVLKAAYLAGQMSRPVKTFSGGKPNYVIPPETPEVTPYVTPDDRGSTGEVPGNQQEHDDALSAQNPASCINRSDIIRMAQEAELNAHGLVIDRLERFAALVAAHEREECAKVCEDASGTGKIISCISAAAAIRARGKK